MTDDEARQAAGLNADMTVTAPCGDPITPGLAEKMGAAADRMSATPIFDALQYLMNSDRSHPVGTHTGTCTMCTYPETTEDSPASR